MQDIAPRRYHSEYKRYLFTYLYGGAEWSVEVAALSLDEARERIKVMPFARYEGESAARRSPTPASEPAARKGGWIRLFGQAA